MSQLCTVTVRGKAVCSRHSKTDCVFRFLSDERERERETADQTSVYKCYNIVYLYCLSIVYCRLLILNQAVLKSITTVVKLAKAWPCILLKTDFPYFHPESKHCLDNASKLKVFSMSLAFLKVAALNRLWETLATRLAHLP